MRKIFFALALAIAGLVTLTPSAVAKDVWIDQVESFDWYIADDTIKGGTTAGGRWVTVTTKEAIGGRLNRTITWKFEEARGDWRYQTDKMDSRITSRVIANSTSGKILAYCLRYLNM